MKAVSSPGSPTSARRSRGTNFVRPPNRRCAPAVPGPRPARAKPMSSKRPPGLTPCSPGAAARGADSPPATSTVRREPPAGTRPTRSLPQWRPTWITATACSASPIPSPPTAPSQADGGVGLVGRYTPPNLPDERTTETPKHIATHGPFVPFSIGPTLSPATVERLVDNIEKLKIDTAGYYHDAGEHIRSVSR